MPEDRISQERRVYLLQRKRQARMIRLLRVLLLVVFLLQWEITARLGVVDAFIVSAPSRIVRTLIGMAQSGDLWLHLGTSVM